MPTPQPPQTPTTPRAAPAGGQPEVTVDLGDGAGGPEPSRTLPHERDQQSGEQAPAAGQDRTREAHEAMRDAERGRPDTSAAPLLQQPSPRR